MIAALGTSGLLVGWHFFTTWADLGWRLDPRDVFNASTGLASWITFAVFTFTIPRLKTNHYYWILGAFIASLLLLLVLWGGSHVLGIKIGHVARPSLAWANTLVACAICYQAIKRR